MIMKCLTTNSSKNIIATLGIVIIEISDLTFLLTLYFHDSLQTRMWHDKNTVLLYNYRTKLKADVWTLTFSEKDYLEHTAESNLKEIRKKTF